MIGFRSTTGREISLPSKVEKDFIYNDESKEYAEVEVEMIDFTRCDVVEGDGKPDYRCQGLVDLLREMKARVSDMILHSACFRADMIMKLGKQKEEAKRVRARRCIELCKNGWEHKEKDGSVIKTSTGILEKIIDGDDEVVAAVNKCHQLQRTVDMLTARKEERERQYFSHDETIKTLCRVLGISF